MVPGYFGPITIQKNWVNANIVDKSRDSQQGWELNRSKLNPAWR